MKNLKNYLIRFTYDHYCQGYEDAVETVLVRNVPSFEAGCNRIKLYSSLCGEYRNARDFHNLTIDIDDE